ncbi:4-(cytidine 5'-diphospho)-2-C-methyl-D-erythritol kinase [Desulforamulus aquiferis]|uniref:4-diphosphocytidyl-2-C-methyl-D-erythritol kinase n=1 Tax=Desulforamulus aquiferis TaxID=1397668 RepID=A0AAW7ZE84_9FIRM|nr:4-(cytidine 5'-diphospho)-2-C-methyl-D-erythritol kinase [Desulforamulus aquiferis]MDO7788074.1 4-(cytidine 5'-diphospho)-2-C-methyl-D-erythritol kinase [Desulforamulus aquiferis]
MSVTLRAHAKINLTLDVLARRPDGYHEVEMIMQSIELHDTLNFNIAQKDITLMVTGLPVPEGADNLVLKAAHLLREFSGTELGATISLNKKIPVAAGLAGGSTDAAATMLGLNQLWNLGLQRDDLMGLALQLGADVSFCLLGGTAIARGIGEVLSPLASAPRFGVVLVKPSFGISTKDVYQNLSLDNLGLRPNTSAMVRALGEGNLKQVAGELVNVLESVTIQIKPELNELKTKLKKAGCQGVLMSGSGPTIFGLTADMKSAVEVAKGLDLPDCQVLVTGMI